MSIHQRFRSDNRAIEGLPIRLVIALVVGVASLSVMMNMLSGLNRLTVSELDAKPEPEVIGLGQQTIEIVVIDADGNPVADATVVVKSDSARLESIETATTESDGRAQLSIEPGSGRIRTMERSKSISNHLPGASLRINGRTLEYWSSASDNPGYP